MTPIELEKVYEALAWKIDDVPSDKRELFLAKPALRLAQEVGDRTRVTQIIGDAGLHLSL